MTNELATTQNTSLGFVADAARSFEGIQRLADLMAKCGTLPKHLQDNPSDCFRIVVQSAKWQMDPFAVGEATSVVHGRLCFEGKLVHAAMIATGAIRGTLRYEFDGPERKDTRSVTVIGVCADGREERISGSVADWKTSHNGSPWSPGNYDKMLRYRGAREWARAYAPHVMLGVATPDEVEPVQREPRTVSEFSVRDDTPKLDQDVDEKREEPAAVSNAETAVDMFKSLYMHSDAGKAAAEALLDNWSMKKASDIADKDDLAIQQFADDIADAMEAVQASS